MRAIKGRDTLPEKIVRSYLHRLGLRFRVCDRKIVGHPDIVLPKWKTLIEVRGCFWHRHGWSWDGRKLVGSETACSLATVPKTNRAFWNRKFRNNVRRDLDHERLWAEQGWKVIVIWECELKPARREATLERLSLSFSSAGEL